MSETPRDDLSRVSLDNMTPLLLPWAKDPWGRMRPPLSVDALRMSVKLAGATYHMAVDNWMEAGWRDVTIQVDGDLTTGFTLPDKELSPMSRLATNLKLRRVRSRLHEQNPIRQVAGALRQIGQSDTGKVLVMIHPAPDGRYVVAISFMGTGSRFYDWFSNFRMSNEDGFHKGFLQLARQFEGNEDKIEFPLTAEELGLEHLTLQQIIREAETPNSRFTLWLTGHSQGGALMQVYAHHKLIEDGVLPHNMVGYGFASPSVVEGTSVADPAAYPLWHVLNSDDLVPRMGAQMHLGVCLFYPSDDDMRQQCYGWSQDETSVQHRAMMMPLVSQMVDTPTCIEAAVAYLNVLAEHSAEEMIEGIGIMDLSHLPIKRFMQAADSRIDDLVRYIRRHAAAAYQSITGTLMNTTRVAQMQQGISNVIDLIGVKAFSGTLMEIMGAPHTINNKENRYGSYTYIALFGVDSLMPAMWRCGRPPELITLNAADTRISDISRTVTALSLRRRESAPRVSRGNRRYSQQRQRLDTRHRTPLLTVGTVQPGELLITPDK